MAAASPSSAGGLYLAGGSAPRGSEGLGGVFEDEEAGVVVLELGEGVHVGALAVEVDGEDGFD